ncbi:hypothetical protein A2W24_06710 [Microgenomates group bacterium RBG_16_45_19]|nr:MAG: hypothetical protein A2W24_06710 [Microgenomates group bacterium RBG_16_45_19]
MMDHGIELTPPERRVSKPPLRHVHIQPLFEQELINTLNAVASNQELEAESRKAQFGKPNKSSLQKYKSASRLKQLADKFVTDEKPTTKNTSSIDLVQYPRDYGLNPDDVTALDNHIHQNELKQMGSTDGLTGLLTRNGLYYKLKQEFFEQTQPENRRTLSPVKPAWLEYETGCVLFIDADWFKLVNDLHHHAIGDIVLKILTSTLMQIFRRDEDFIVRYGGEELVVILPGITLDQIQSRYTSFIHGYHNDLSKDVNIPETLHKETVSIGAAIYSQSDLIRITEADLLDYDSITNALSRLTEPADRACYEAKKAGRNRLVLFRGYPDNFETVLPD